MEIKPIENNQWEDFVYWACKFPWPLTNRDYVYSRKIVTVDEGKEMVFINKACAHPAKPEKSGFVRVDTYIGHYRVIQDGDKCLIRIKHEDDLKGSIPTTIVNWFNEPIFSHSKHPIRSHLHIKVHFLTPLGTPRKYEFCPSVASVPSREGLKRIS